MLQGAAAAINAHILTEPGEGTSRCEIRRSIKTMKEIVGLKGSLIFCTKFAFSCFFATGWAMTALAMPVCAPPVPPFLPASDATFREYADLINQDFERYFSEMSSYSACLDRARAELLAEAQAVSRLHSEFLARVEALGVARKAATPMPYPDGAVGQDTVIEEWPQPDYQFR